MFDVEWIHVGIGIGSAAVGAAGGIFASGWRLGRIESRMELRFQQGITACEQRIEDKVTEAVRSFDETLKGMRQKINDVELDAVRRFLPREEFNDFREEYRDDMRDIKALIRNGHK